MYLAYTALDNCAPFETEKPTQHTNERLLRYLAYLTACSKMSREIAAIQKYMPGWRPVFR